MKTRSVSIRGTPKNVSVGVMKIYGTLEKLSEQIDNLEKTAVRYMAKLIYYPRSR